MSMLDDETLALVRQVMGRYCDAPPETIVPEATLAELDVDSLSLAEMLFLLEDELGTSLAGYTERPTTVADLMKVAEPYMPALLAKRAA